MSSKTRFLFVALIILILAAVMTMKGQQPAQEPAATTEAAPTSQPVDGMMAAPEEAAPAASDAPAAAESEVDGVPSGAEVTGEAAPSAPTTPAPTTTPAE